MAISVDSNYEVNSTNNSSTSNLTSGATFTGLSDSSDDFDGAHISLFATQNCTIQVQQSSNGTNWDISDSFTTTANVGFSTTVNSISSFIRVLVTNNGASTTSSFRLQTQYTVSGTNTPRSLGQKTSQESLAVVLASDQSTINTNAIPASATVRTYSAAVTGLTVAASPTDVFTITGSASATIRVLRVEISAWQTTVANRAVRLIKRSTANSGGTSTNLTEVPHDSNDAAASATVLSYTANPTLGTEIGIVRSIILPVPNQAPTNAQSQTGISVWEWDLTGLSGGKGIVLRGISQVLAVNLNAVASAGSSFNIDITWTEE